MWQGEIGYRPPRTIPLVERIPIALTDTARPQPPAGSGYSSRGSSTATSRREVHAPFTEAPPHGPRRGPFVVRREWCGRPTAPPTMANTARRAATGPRRRTQPPAPAPKHRSLQGRMQVETTLGAGNQIAVHASDDPVEQLVPRAPELVRRARFVERRAQVLPTDIRPPAQQHAS